MIVESPNAYNLTVGQRSRIPQDGDAQVSVPPLIMPVALTAEPHVNTLTSAIEARSSCMYSDAFSATNSALTQIQLALLGPGLWELEFTMASLFNFNTTTVLGMINAILVTPNLGSNQKFVLTRWAQVGSFTDYNRIRVLFRNGCTVISQIGATNNVATDSAAISVTMNAIKML